MRFHLIMVFWGERFAHHLCKEALPPLLATGNLPDWPWLAETSLEIYCPAPDWKTIADTPILQECQALLQVNWHEIELPSPEQKYQQMGAIHARAIEAARQAQAAVILLGPDCIFCAGSFQVLAEQLEAGTEMVLIPGPIVSREQFLEQKSGMWSKAWGQNLIAQAAHPSFRAAHLSQSHFPAVPSALLYSQNGHLKGRFFHLHPLLIRHPLPMKIENYQLSPTIDGEYLQEFELSATEIWVDQHQAIVAFSLHSEQEAREAELPLDFRERLARVLRIARGTYSDFHYHLAQSEIDLGEAHARWPESIYSDEVDSHCVDLVCRALAIHQAYLQEDWVRTATHLQALSASANVLHTYLHLLDLELLMPFYQVLLALFCLRRQRELLATQPHFQPFLRHLANAIPENDQPGFSDCRSYLSEAARLPSLQADPLWQEQLPEGPFLLVGLQTPDHVDRLAELETEQIPAQALVLIAPAALLEMALAHESWLSDRFDDLLFWEAETLSAKQKGQLVDQAVGVILEGHFCYFNLALRACLQGNLHAIF
ncbi:MAG: hypothetical protein AB7I41_22535 [Candidatus Sericytochromatia bacterium]